MTPFGFFRWLVKFACIVGGAYLLFIVLWVVLAPAAALLLSKIFLHQ